MYIYTYIYVYTHCIYIYSGVRYLITHVDAHGQLSANERNETTNIELLICI